jgi:hypothetical protein
MSDVMRTFKDNGVEGYDENIDSSVKLIYEFKYVYQKSRSGASICGRDYTYVIRCNLLDL